jgi:hypothetical protein
VWRCADLQGNANQVTHSVTYLTEIENHDPPAKSPEEARKLAENVK